MSAGAVTMDEQYEAPPPEALLLRRPLMWNGARPTPGVSVDRIDVAAGVRELLAFWPDAPLETRMVIEYALNRWARGEEAQAERGAIDQKFHGVDFGSWRRILAAARAAGEANVTENAR